MSEDTSGANLDLADFARDQGADVPPPNGQDATAADPRPAETRPGRQTDAEPEDPQRSAADLEAVFDIPVNIAAVLGRTQLDVNELLKLDEGDVVELDRKVGEAIDIYVNNRLVARGEVVLVEDRLGVTMTEIIKGEDH